MHCFSITVSARLLTSLRLGGTRKATSPLALVPPPESLKYLWENLTCLSSESRAFHQPHLLLSAFLFLNIFWFLTDKGFPVQLYLAPHMLCLGLPYFLISVCSPLDIHHVLQAPGNPWSSFGNPLPIIFYSIFCNQSGFIVPLSHSNKLHNFTHS